MSGAGCGDAYVCGARGELIDRRRASSAMKKEGWKRRREGLEEGRKECGPVVMGGTSSAKGGIGDFLYLWRWE